MTETRPLPSMDAGPPDPAGQPDAAELTEGRPRQGPAAAVWSGLTAVVGSVMGLVPHVLHHVSFFAGAALVTGAGGSLVFGAVGVLLSVPLLRRLYRRFGTWKAPAVALAVFAAMFSLSAFVIGPAISGDDDPTRGPAPAPGETVSPDEHEQHHD